MSTTESIKDWAVLPYNTERIRDRYLISNFLGSWELLTLDEFKQLQQLRFTEDETLFTRLYDKGIIVKEENLPEMINEYRNLQSHLFTDASLHIAVLTTRCNIACSYCQTRTEAPKDMDMTVAAQVLKFCFDMSNPNVHLEFQGGEPLLNWDMLTFLVEHIHKFNTINKNISISLVTNGTLLDQDKIDFLVDHGVNICISLDGPANVHDRNRVFSGGGETYDKVAEAIQRLKQTYQDRGINKLIHLLPTLNRDSLPFAKEIIDEYVKWGVDQVSIRPINKIGGAQCHWDAMGYSPEEFNQFWAQSMDYILELNKQGINIQERMANAMLQKILKKQNPGYVDLMSPCGAGRSVLTYLPNGDIYPCDEARMLGCDIFKLGNVLENTYEELMKSANLFSICESSVMDLWDYNSAFLPWTGTCPVLNYASQGTIVPKITQTPKHKIHRFQFRYLFEKMLEDQQNKEIFEKWIS